MRLIFIILATIVASSFCEYPMLKYSCKEEFGYFNNIKYYGILPNEVGSQDVISKKSSKNAGRSYAMVSFHVKVIDDQERPIPNVKIQGGLLEEYILSHNGQGGFQTFTDENGMAHVSGKCDGVYLFTAIKAGWYNSIPTTIRYSVDNLINEMWQPSDLTHKIVLKEIKNPIPMFQNSFCGKLSIDTPVGFDLFTGDFVSPNKNGRNADFFLTYGKKETEEEKIETLTITFPNKGDGGYRAIYNYGSEFRTAYDAYTNNDKYISKMVFHRKTRFSNEKGWGGKLVRKESLVSEDNIHAKDEYLVIRTRSIVDLYERHISSYYSQIYNNADSGIEFADGNLSFHWRTNPFLNDRNLETKDEYKPSIIQLCNSGILYDGIDRNPINPEYYKYDSVRKCLVVFLDDVESAHLLPLVLDNCNKYGVKPQLILRMMNQKQGEVAK